MSQQLSIQQKTEMYIKEITKSQEKLKETFDTLQAVSVEGITTREQIMQKMQEIEASNEELKNQQTAREISYKQLNKQIQVRTDKLNTDKKKLLTQIEAEQTTIQNLQIEAETTAKQLEILTLQNTELDQKIKFIDVQAEQLNPILVNLPTSKATCDDLKSYASQFREIKNKHKELYFQKFQEAEIVMNTAVKQEEQAFLLLQEISTLIKLKDIFQK